jgi:hypothetical protein
MFRRKESIVMFGAGAGAERARAWLRHRYRIAAYADNDARKHGTFVRGRPVIGPAGLAAYPTERIHIASMYADDIHRQLTVDLGIDPARVSIVPRPILQGAYEVSPWTYAALSALCALALAAVGALGLVSARFAGLR